MEVFYKNPSPHQLFIWLSLRTIKGNLSFSYCYLFLMAFNSFSPWGCHSDALASQCLICFYSLSSPQLFQNNPHGGSQAHECAIQGWDIAKWYSAEVWKLQITFQPGDSNFLKQFYFSYSKGRITTLACASYHFITPNLPFIDMFCDTVMAHVNTTPWTSWQCWASKQRAPEGHCKRKELPFLIPIWASSPSCATVTHSVWEAPVALTVQQVFPVPQEQVSANHLWLTETPGNFYRYFLWINSSLLTFQQIYLPLSRLLLRPALTHPFCQFVGLQPPAWPCGSHAPLRGVSMVMNLGSCSDAAILKFSVTF